MARPRKDALDAHVEERIEEAFWKLSETTTVEHISIVALSQHAHCNRGTFYYYHHDIYDLLDSIISRNMPESIFAPVLFDLSDSRTSDDLRVSFREHYSDLHRLGLIINRSSSGYAVESMAKRALEMYSNALGKKPEDLSMRDRLWCEFLTNGMVGVLKHIATSEAEIDPEELSSAFFPEISQAIVAHTTRRIEEGAFSLDEIRRISEARSQKR